VSVTLARRVRWFDVPGGPGHDAPAFLLTVLAFPSAAMANFVHVAGAESLPERIRGFMGEYACHR
jgi:hypothetical protein